MVPNLVAMGIPVTSISNWSASSKSLSRYGGIDSFVGSSAE